MIWGSFLPAMSLSFGRRTIRLPIPARWRSEARAVVAFTGKDFTVGKIEGTMAVVDLYFPRRGPRVTRVCLMTADLQTVPLYLAISLVLSTQSPPGLTMHPPRLAEIRRRPLDKSIEFGVNFYGHIGAISGLGNVARNYILSLTQQGIPVLGLNATHQLTPLGFPVVPLDTPPRYSHTVAHISPEKMIEFVMRAHPSALQGRRTIVAAAWELELTPPAWKQYEAYFDEVWALSDFSARAFRATFDRPVHVVPGCVGELEHLLQFGRAHFGVDPEAYIYLYVFDVGSIFERKNPLVLVRTFQQVYGDAKEVQLVLKVGNPHKDPANADLLRREIAQGGNIRLIDTVLSEAELYSLMAVADCYVSPHRSEGFGLTPAESLMLGKPVIATDYGSTTDFLNVDTGYPISYQLTELDRDYGPYMKGARWADISVTELGQTLIHVRKNPAEAQKKALCGQQMIRDNFSPRAVGQKLAKILSSESCNY